MYIELNNVNKYFGDFQASKDICFGVKKGQLAALLGSSGSGKTTILRIIAGLETPDSGDIIIDGKRVNNVPPALRGSGFVFQNYALFRYMTVYENVAFGLAIKKQNKRDIRDRVYELLDLTELRGLEKRYPNELSGGQRQRVAFARALAPSPRILLLDEPFAAIDAKVRRELRQWLREMIHKIGITSIFVTHDQDEATEIADQIIVMNQGCVEQIGTPYEIYKNPKTAFVAGFIGEPIFVRDFGCLKGFEKGGYEYSVIRPEFVEAFKSDNTHFKDILAYSQKGTITDIIFCGNMLQVGLDISGQRIITYRSMERRPISIGEEMNVIIYRIFAVSGNEVTPMENENLKK